MLDYKTLIRLRPELGFLVYMNKREPIILNIFVKSYGYDKLDLLQNEY